MKKSWKAQQAISADEAIDARLLKTPGSCRIRTGIRPAVGKTLITLNRSEDARPCENIPLQDRDLPLSGLVAQIELLKQAADTPIQRLQQRVAENPECRTGGATGTAAAPG